MDFNLDLIKEEDRNLIQDILSVVKKVFVHCKSWNINTSEKRYEIILSMDCQKNNNEFHVDDLNLIKNLDNWRIPIVTVRFFSAVPQIKIVVIPRSERIVIQDMDILRIQKRRKFWDFSS